VKLRAHSAGNSRADPIPVHGTERTAKRNKKVLLQTYNLLALLDDC